MNFIDICWLIVKICGGLIVLFAAIGFAAKQIGKQKEKEFKKQEGKE